MSIQVIVADRERHTTEIRELFQEYLHWANLKLNEAFNINFDVNDIIENDMQSLDKFMPPRGRLLLAYTAQDLAGIACLKPLTASIGEVKRMFVRPRHRKQGLGRALLMRLLQEAKHIGYQSVRLDSARFMKEAHRLYRSSGFKEIPAYEGSEIRVEFQGHWVFMEKVLEPSANIEEHE